MPGRPGPPEPGGLAAPGGSSGDALGRLRRRRGDEDATHHREVEAHLARVDAGRGERPLAHPVYGQRGRGRQRAQRGAPQDPSGHDRRALVAEGTPHLRAARRAHVDQHQVGRPHVGGPPVHGDRRALVERGAVGQGRASDAHVFEGQRRLGVDGEAIDEAGAGALERVSGARGQLAGGVGRGVEHARHEIADVREGADGERHERAARAQGHVADVDELDGAVAGSAGVDAGGPERSTGARRRQIELGADHALGQLGIGGRAEAHELGGDARLRGAVAGGHPLDHDHALGHGTAGVGHVVHDGRRTSDARDSGEKDRRAKKRRHGGESRSEPPGGQACAGGSALQKVALEGDLERPGRSEGELLDI